MVRWIEDGLLLLRTLVPPSRALFLAAMVGMLLGNAMPMSYLQQAASPLAHLSGSVLSGF